MQYRKLRWIARSIALLATLAQIGEAQRGQKAQEVFRGMTRQYAIDSLLGGRPLALIEGVWIWDDNSYEIVITRADSTLAPGYEYVGIVISSTNKKYQPGRQKITLRQTVSDHVFAGTYFLGNREGVGRAFLLTSDNTIEASIPTGDGGAIEPLRLLRTFPTRQSASGIAMPSGTPAPTSSGTGFFVSAGLIATNAHVVVGAKSVSVLTASGEVPAAPIMVDTVNDIALLAIAQETGVTRCLPIARELARSGDAVVSLGYPLVSVLGSELQVAQGIVSQDVGIGSDPRLFQISAPTQPGSSGSPLLNSHAEVVGVVTAILRGRSPAGVVPQNVNFALRTAYLGALLGLRNAPTCNASPSSTPLDARGVREAAGGSVVQVRAVRP